MKFEALTDRQREVATAIIRGYSPSEIAQLYGISSKTFYTHRQRVFEALGIDSDVQLFALALREELAEWRAVEHPAIARAMGMLAEVLP